MSNLFQPLQSISGLASGLDTSSLLTQLLSLERRPRVQLEQRQAVETARRDALAEVKTRLAAVRTAAAALQDPTLWSAQQTVGSSDPGRVTATATGTATPGSYYVGVDRLATSQQLTQGGAFAAATADDTLTIRVAGGAAVDVAVSAGDDAAALAAKINAASGIEVEATVVDGKLVLDGTRTGSASTISVTSAAGTNDLAGSLGLTQTRASQDASFLVNSTAYTSSTNTDTAAIPGVTLTLSGVTASAATLTIGANTAKATITNRVQAFVDAYNSLVDYASAKLNDDRVANPQTDADRQKGMLRNDSTLRSLLSDLRTSVSDVFAGRPGEADQLAEAGVSTGAATGSGAVSKDSVAGRLTFDASKLSSLLDSSFSDVKALFTNPTGAYASEGLVQRLDRRAGPYLSSGGIIDVRVSSEQSAIDDLGRRMAALDVRLGLRETALRKQFADLEVALQSAQSQGNWLSGQIAGLGR